MCACVCVHVCAWATSLLTELSRALAKTVSLFSGCFGGWFFYIEIAPTSDSLGGKRVEWDKNYLIFSVYSNYISVLFPAAPFLSAHFVQMNETADLHFLGQLCGCDVLFLRFPRQKDTLLSPYPSDPYLASWSHPGLWDLHSGSQVNVGWHQHDIGIVS